MKRRALLPILHTLHLAVLAAVIYCLWQQDRHEKNEARLFRSLQVTRNFAQRQMEDLQGNMMESMHEYVYSYPSPYNLTCFEKAGLINEQCDQALLLLADERQAPGEMYRPLSVLADSLTASVRKDTALAARFNRLLFSFVPPERFAYARPAQTAVLREDLRINVLFARYWALGYCAVNISGLDMRFDRFAPVWQPDAVCAPATEIFTTNLFLGLYPNYYLHPKWSRVWVNGTECPVQNGYGSFKTRFDRSGPQPLSVRVEVNSLKTEHPFFEKTYTVYVK